MSELELIRATWETQLIRSEQLKPEAETRTDLIAN